MFQILVVEDDKELRDLFCSVLTESGYHPLPAANGLEALEIMDSTLVDLVLSDIMIPGMDGFELTRILRETGSAIPILMITARESHADKREGFRLGTDDYMVKPIDVNEMVWRVQALLRRSQNISQRKAQIGETTLDCNTLMVTTRDRQIELPQKEFFLLFKLITSPGHIFTRRQIMDDVWGIDSAADPHTLEVHISRLRDRFRDNPDFEIVTVRGLGYKAVKKDA